MDFMKEREDFQKKSIGHSNTLAFDKDRHQIYKFTATEQACYAHITYSPNISCEYLFIFFGKDTYFNLDRIKSWSDWVINKSFYRDAFITKDVKEGLKYGFQIDTHIDRATMQGGMFALRHIFEFKKRWCWQDFIDLGYDEYESYALASNVIVHYKKLINNHSNTNHYVIQKDEPFSRYLGKHKSNNKVLNKPLCEGFNPLEGFSTSLWGCKASWSEGVNIGLPLHFNKENCDKILNYLKEKDKCVE